MGIAMAISRDEAGEEAWGERREEGAGWRIWMGVAPAMLLPALSSIFYFHLFPQARVSWVLYTGTKIFTIVWPVVAILAIEGARPRPGPVDWRKHVRALPLGFLTGAVIPVVPYVIGGGTAAFVDARTWSRFCSMKVSTMARASMPSIVISRGDFISSCSESPLW